MLRTPPQTREEPSANQVNSNPETASLQPNASLILDPTQQSCTRCKNFDTLEMVQCDNCKNWLHFVCVGVTGEITEQEFVCQQCTIDVSAASRRTQDRTSSTHSRKSKGSASSAARSDVRRKQLALERLEEERKLSEARDKKYLDKKYATLEQFNSGSSVGSKSDDESETLSSANEYTVEWIMSQRKQVKPNESKGLSLTIVPETDDLVKLDGEANGQRARIDRSSSVVTRNNVDESGVDVNNANPPLTQQTTISIPEFIPTVPTVCDTQFVQQNSTFCANSASQGAVRKPTNPLHNWNLSIESPICSSQNQVSSQTDVLNPTSRNQFAVQQTSATYRQVNETPALNTTTEASYISVNSSPVVNFGVVRQNRAATTNLYPSTSPANYRTAPESNFQRPLAIQSTTTRSQDPTIGLSMTTQLQGQSNTGTDLIFSAEYAPRLSSYVVSSGYDHLWSTSQMVQQFSAQSISNNVTNRRALWNGGESNAREFIQWQTERERPNGNDTNLQEQSRQRVDPYSSPATSFGYLRNDKYCQQPTSTVYQCYDRQPPSWSTIPPTNHALTSQQSMNPNQNLNGYVSAPVSSRQNVIDTNLQFLDDTNVTAAVGSRLTPNQIAARHVVGKDLPVFYGDIEKFPAFIRAFETTTEMCGYTYGENLNRLLKCLKGVAMEFVEQQLCYPEDVPQVIETLKTLYNQPEFIIERLIRK